MAMSYFSDKELLSMYVASLDKSKNSVRKEITEELEKQILYRMGFSDGAIAKKLPKYDHVFDAPKLLKQSKVSVKAQKKSAHQENMKSLLKWGLSIVSGLVVGMLNSIWFHYTFVIKGVNYNSGNPVTDLSIIPLSVFVAIGVCVLCRILIFLNNIKYEEYGTSDDYCGY